VHNSESRRESAVKEVFYMYPTMCQVVSSCPTAPFCTWCKGQKEMAAAAKQCGAACGPQTEPQRARLRV